MYRPVAQNTLIVGNWKMNGLSANATDLAREIALGAGSLPDRTRVVIAPPFTQLGHVARLVADSSVLLSAQDCHPAPSGAHTGDISAEMLADAGAEYVILGHSERRKHHHETDELVQQKALAAARAGLTPIVCVGETAEERDEGRTLTRLAQQIRHSLPRDFHGVVAYEPIWAIGSGRSASCEDIEETVAALHASIASHLGTDDRSTAILYGGSVTARDAASILSVSGVGGVLVGGASLSAGSFLDIARSAFVNAD